jgi:hypothetical protein
MIVYHTKDDPRRFFMACISPAVQSSLGLCVISAHRLHSNSVHGLHFLRAFGSKKRINWESLDTFILVGEGEVKETRGVLSLFHEPGRSIMMTAMESGLWIRRKRFQGQRRCAS